jgi:hypothetical protein
MPGRVGQFDMGHKGMAFSLFDYEQPDDIEKMAWIC